jgi:D-glycero-D-manno-heptose 1,7-bisphosphate phosphatase
MTRGVILDRDGTLIEEVGYLDRLDRLQFYPYSVDAVRLLNRAGFKVAIATNQSGVARGIVEESFVSEAHKYIGEQLAAGGARVDAFYYCPHHPDAPRREYAQTCECRKPSPGMLRRAAADLDLDLARSFVVGDRWNDIEAGAAVGARSVLVRTGYGRISETQASTKRPPAVFADNLVEAVSWILRQS